MHGKTEKKNNCWAFVGIILYIYTVNTVLPWLGN